jgi:hypothetical protein
LIVKRIAAPTHKMMTGVMTARFVMSSEAPLFSAELIPEWVVEIVQDAHGGTLVQHHTRLFQQGLEATRQGRRWHPEDST